MILKLEKGGEPVPFFVQRVTDDVSRKPSKERQYQFSGRTPEADDATVWVAVDTAERQFSRIGFTRESIVGKWVAFAKTAEGHIDIMRPERGAAPAVPAVATVKPSNGNGAPAPAAPPPPAASPAATPAADDAAARKLANKKAWTRSLKTYDACLAHVLAVSVPALTAKGIPITHEGIATMAAALLRRSTHADLV